MPLRRTVTYGPMKATFLTPIPRSARSPPPGEGGEGSWEDDQAAGLVPDEVVVAQLDEKAAQLRAPGAAARHHHFPLAGAQELPLGQARPRGRPPGRAAPPRGGPEGLEHLPVAVRE